jgi:hypothetical protein
VRDQCGLIFGEEHRPLVLAKNGSGKKPAATADGDEPSDHDDDTTEWIAAFIHDTNFWLVLMDALWKGSIGSSVIVLRVLGDSDDVEDEDEATGEKTKRNVPKGPGAYYFEVWSGVECAPVFKRSRPDVLESIDRRYFIGEDALSAQGYDVKALKEQWDKKQKGWQTASKNMLGRLGATAANEWTVRIKLDDTNETWYEPVPRYIYERPDWNDSKWVQDASRTFAHDIGEVPAQWVRPLPINADDLYPDGACLFEDVIDFEYRINRTISQVGRAFDYSGDPQMARAKGAGGGIGRSTFGTPTAMGGTASDVIEIDEGGEAKFVEITGAALAIAIDSYAGAMRDFAKAAGAMSRVSPDSQTGAQPLSSVAMKMLNFAQLTLSGILRETAAERPGGNLMRLAMRLWTTLDIELPSLENAKAKPDETARFEWQWPEYYESHGQEKLFEIQAIAAAQTGSMISAETAMANAGPMFDVSSTDDEKKKIEGDKTDQLDQQVTQATAMGQVQAKFAPEKGPPTGATPSASSK